MRLLLAALVCLVLAGCAKKSDLDAANANLKKANADLATANANLGAANKMIDDLKAQVAALQAQLAVKPKLPVVIGVRKALLGGALMLVFNTTVKAPIQVLATVRNPTLGTEKQIELQLRAFAPTILGAQQGVPIDPGDVVTLANGNYSTASYVVNPQ